MKKKLKGIQKKEMRSKMINAYNMPTKLDWLNKKMMMW